MQAKKYSIPSARIRTLIKRNTLHTLEQRESADDTWLNDMSSRPLTTATQTQAHSVFYEDLPTMPLSVLKPLTIPYAVPAHSEEFESAPEEDKTVKFEKRKKVSVASPLDALLQDATISVITALGPRNICIERDGIVQQTPLRFSDESHMMQVIEQLLTTANCTLASLAALPTQRVVTDVCLPDGTLLTVALPPHAPHGPALTLRKRRRTALTLPELVRHGSLEQATANILYAHVQACANILVCGHIGSGRTTLLNALCAAIPIHERIITIEDVAELCLPQAQVTMLQGRCLSSERTEHTTIPELIAYAERVRANRLILGECRSDAAFALLQAMYGGLNGVMTTMYAHNAQDCLTRFETLCSLGSKEHSYTHTRLIKAQIAQSIQVIVLLSPEHKVREIVEL